MQLENLKKAREESSQIQLSISDKELIERYEAVFTAAVNDVLREMGYLYQTLPNAIQGLTTDMRVAGLAFTIKGVKASASAKAKIEAAGGSISEN